MSLFRKPSDTHEVSSIFPTYLLPSLPFRRGSRHSSTDSTVSASSAATISSAASNPFSRCPTPVPVPIATNLPIEEPTDKYLGGHTSHLHCAKCSTDLCLTSQIISKGFTGRHGRAYLIQGSATTHGRHVRSSVLPNTFLSKAVPRNLVTGQHMVSDIACSICGSLLGWKYVEASEESQKYKVGKFILETKKIRVGVRWDNDIVVGGDGGGYDEILPLPPSEIARLNDVASSSGAAIGGGDPLEFDSQDEDECEDLFAGVWSPALAARRRQRKSERYRRKAAKVYVPRGSQESLT